MESDNEHDLPERLKRKAELSAKQIDTVMTWLSKHEDKVIDFALMLRKEIEMKIESGVVKKDGLRKKGVDIQQWAWQQIQAWVADQEKSGTE